MFVNSFFYSRLPAVCQTRTTRRQPTSSNPQGVFEGDSQMFFLPEKIFADRQKGARTRPRLLDGGNAASYPHSKQP
jgi:hypothetical protein